MLRILLILQLLLLSFFSLAQEEGSAKGYFEKIPQQIQKVYINPYLQYVLTEKDAIDAFAWYRVQGETTNGTLMNIPSESGRAFETPFRYGKNYAQTLVKGSGANTEFTENNTIKYVDKYSSKPVDFHGKFKITEAYLDMYNAEFLSRIGVKTSLPLAILDLGADQTFSAADSKIKNHACLYVRSFEEQLRISNLTKLSDLEVKQAFDRVTTHLFETGQTAQKLSLKEYFYFITERMATNAGRLQAAGFQHGVLHNQQVTLLGELTDLGTGYWKDFPAFNSNYQQAHSPYSFFENQPIQFQNMLFRTHSMSGEKPEILLSESETLRNHNKSLLGAILRVDPEVGAEIIKEDPGKFFWNHFDESYRNFDREHFLKNFNPTMHFVLEEGLIKPKDFLNQGKSLSEAKLLRQRTDAKILARNFTVDQKVLSYLEPSKVTFANNEKPPIIQELENLFATSKDTYVPDEIWKLKINDDSVKFHKYLQDFSEKLTQIQDGPGTLKQKWSRSMDLIASHMRLQYRGSPSLFRDGISYTYNHYKRYNFGGANIDYLIDAKKGACHDQCIIGYFLGKEVEKVYPDFDFRIFKSKNIGNTNRTHFYIMAKVPDGDIKLIDPLWGFNQKSIDDLLKFPYTPKATEAAKAYFDHQEYLSFEENAQTGKCSHQFYKLPH